MIDPGPRSITGRSTQGATYRFDSGKFMGTKVPLGELRTDDQGRLVVLGGFGTSASYLKKPATTFANNDGWHDDTSDGSVRATVTIGGKKLEAEPAAVAVTPPNFGPGLYGVVTMYDVVYDLFCRDPKFALDPPTRPSFWRHIYPMLSRLVDTGWVNSGVDVLFGPGSPSHLTTPELLAQLADPAPAFQALRTSYAELVPRSGRQGRGADAGETAAVLRRRVRRLPRARHGRPGGDPDPVPLAAAVGRRRLRSRPVPAPATGDAGRLPDRVISPARSMRRTWRAAWAARSTPASS